jgi:hypothetical protein
MSKLREPFDALERDIAATIIGATKGTDTPSAYALAPGIEALIRKYEIALRPVPLDRDEVREEWPRICPVCCKAIMQGGTVYELRIAGRREQHAHIECVAPPSRDKP